MTEEGIFLISATLSQKNTMVQAALVAALHSMSFDVSQKLDC